MQATREHFPHFFSFTGGNGLGNGGNGTTPPTGNRRQQYTLDELPFVCDYCPARYKTKPGLQYHLAKHKDKNGEYRPSSSAVADSNGSPSPSSTMMKQKYMNPPMEHQPQPHHPMLPNHHPPGNPMMYNNPGNKNTDE